jgi:predicted signal transduction protein with EAL and GGDEF domain
MLGLFLSSQPRFYGYAIAIVLIVFALIRIGHSLLDLLRDYRDFRDGY